MQVRVLPGDFMFGEVVPIATTQVSWPMFIDRITDLTGNSPTRGLDDESIRKGPATFAQCIDLKNTPHAALREYNPHLCHIQVCLMVEGDDQFARNLTSVRGLLVSSPAAGVIYVSSTLDLWDQSIRRMLRKPMNNWELQKFFTVVYGIFRSIGYKDLWNDLETNLIGNDITLLQ